MIESKIADTVFFDGSCPLCRREMAWYKRQPGAGEISWIDVSQEKEGMITSTLSKAAALKRLHVLLTNGSLVSGAEAFVSIWRVLTPLQTLSGYLNHPIILWALEQCYKLLLIMRPFLQRITLLYLKRKTFINKFKMKHR